MNIAGQTADSRAPRRVQPWGYIAFFLVSQGALTATFELARAADSQTSTVVEPENGHWSFQRVVRPHLPPPVSADWPEHSAIDRFVQARFRNGPLSPAAAAQQRTLIRRLTFDLTGLPPDPDEADRFASNQLPDALPRLVDRLLGSPQYGQRWAQHWLDLARFAETDGFEHDKARAEAWRYRDWVVDALNQDVPYDEFIRAQLAADELLHVTDDSTVATAFCLSGPDMPDINSQEERRQSLLNEMTATVGSVFLALQLGCAQCHDHKYDPVSQVDFYRLRAVFEPAVHVKRNESVFKLMVDPTYDRTSHVMIRGDWRRKGEKIEAGFPRVLGFSGSGHGMAADEARGRRLALAQWLTNPKHPLTSRVIVNRVWQHHFGEGLSRTPSDFGTMGDPPSHPMLLDWLAHGFMRDAWSLKRLHRRVVTSHTYQQASHPQREDLEAQQPRELRRQWEQAVAADPQNRLLARFPLRRLDAESIRDALLAVSDKLSSRVGGPGVMPPLPPELVGTLLKNQWNVSSDPEDHLRRSVYIFARRNLRYPIFDAFDRPDANASCAQRNRSTTATQSLLLMNSELTYKAAEDLARYLQRHVRESAAAQIRLAFRRTLSRHPTDEEVNVASHFLKSQRRKMAEAAGASSRVESVQLEDADHFQHLALTDLCLALLNSNEFIYIE